MNTNKKQLGANFHLRLQVRNSRKAGKRPLKLRALSMHKEPTETQGFIIQLQVTWFLLNTT